VTGTTCPVVMPGLDPGIHSVTVVIVADVTEWMPWSSHGMTTKLNRY
jgi:hypothetical protein